MFALIPYRVNVKFQRWPIGNFILMGLCLLFFVLSNFSSYQDFILDNMILTHWSVSGLVGHQFLHAGLGHLFANMIFLWVFGNPVCERMGNIPYVVMFLLSGAFAGAMHLAFDGAPAVGASGAVNAVVGFYLVMYPENEIDCAWLFFIRFGSFSTPGFVIILFWFMFDIFGALTGSAGVAYWAHVGGFLMGFCMAMLLVGLRLIHMESYDLQTLFDKFGGKTSVLEARSRMEPTQKPRSHNLPVMPNLQEVSALDPDETPEDHPRISFACSLCGQDLEAPPDMSGEQIECPACDRLIEIP
jgi:membrane associated rhomboid family serine protease/DNA-directed RNA polymerase subunit RPC12/RpoP